MENIRNFYRLSEIIFFLLGFLLFIFGMFLKNGFFTNISKVFLFVFDLPFIFFAISYGLLSIRFSISEEENTVLDASLFYIGASFFIFVVFVHFSYPNLI